MKIAKSELQKIIKEEMINERRERERTPAFAYLRKIQDYFEDVAEDVENSELVARSDNPEHRKVAQEWFSILQQGRESSDELLDQLGSQREKIEKDIMRLNIANKNAIALQQFVSGKSESGLPPKFTTET